MKLTVLLVLGISAAAVMSVAVALGLLQVLYWIAG